MKFVECPNCNEKVPDGKHCSNCGTTLITEHSGRFDPDYEEKFADKVAAKVYDRLSKDKQNEKDKRGIRNIFIDDEEEDENSNSK